MYQFAYTEIVDDSRVEMRTRERDALDRILGMLNPPEDGDPQSRSVIDGLYYLQRLWTIFIADLQQNDNELPDQLRAHLISIGGWTLKAIERVRSGSAGDLGAIIEINTIIRDGLK